MYDVALGMYDFELVLMVAEKSQKVIIKVDSSILCVFMSKGSR